MAGMMGTPPPPPECTSSYDVYSKTNGSGYEPGQYGSQPPRSVRLLEPSQEKSVSYKNVGSDGSGWCHGTWWYPPVSWQVFVMESDSLF